MSESNVGSGLLFKNFRKRQEKHPDYTGTIEINGEKYDLAAWIKPLRSGKGKFMSISVSIPKPKDNGLPPADAPATPRNEPAHEPEQEPKTGDIPF